MEVGEAVEEEEEGNEGGEAGVDEGVPSITGFKRKRRLWCGRRWRRTFCRRGNRARCTRPR